MARLVLKPSAGSSNKPIHLVPEEPHMESVREPGLLRWRVEDRRLPRRFWTAGPAHSVSTVQARALL